MQDDGSADDDFLLRSALLFDEIDDGEGVAPAVPSSSESCDRFGGVVLIDETDLEAAMRRIALSPGIHRDKTAKGEIVYKLDLVKRHMGCMAQCRGKKGDVLREAGAIDALLLALGGMIDGTWGQEEAGPRLPAVCSSKNGMSSFDHIDDVSIDLAIACFGALRDLACGNAGNRSAIITFTFPKGLTGIHVLNRYVERYHLLTWNEILNLPGIVSAPHSFRGKKELRLFTNAVGAIRNATHSTPPACDVLHNLSATDMMIWKLKCGEGNMLHDDGADSTASICLPDASKPWREACYRIAGSLINMSEKCQACADRCGMDMDLVYMLVDAWGGQINDSSVQPMALTPPLHLGLAAVLNSAEKRLQSHGGLDRCLAQILEKEEVRKKAAQERENARKELREVLKT